MDNAQLYTFSWNNEKTHEGITYPIDTLDRARYASFLTNFLIAEANNGGYVLNINAPWGTGKTYFLNRWLFDLKEKHPVVYIDAWKQDFSNDPMLSVVSSIIDQLKSQLPTLDKMTEDIIDKTWRVMKTITPVIAKGLTKKALGADIFNDEEGEERLSKDDNIMISTAAVKLTENMVKNHNATLTSIKYFKESIKEWIEAIQIKTELNTPTFIFIDELDRCRPTYAVQMLEVIKHFFEMDNIIFVVATDTEQLQHAIKAVYGQEFDAQTYLGRFFHRRCTLQSVSKEHFVNNYLARTSITKISDLYERKLWPQLRNEKDLTTLIVQLDQLYDFSLRDLEQIIDKVISIILVTEIGVNLIILILFFMLHEKNKLLFQSMMKKDYFDEFSYTGSGEGNQFIEDSQAYIFNFSFRGDYVFPQSFNLDKNIESVTLEDILKTVYDSFNLNQEEQKDKIESLKYNGDINNIYHSSDKRKCIAQGIHASTVKIEDYKNWVELAVSFDA